MIIPESKFASKTREEEMLVVNKIHHSANFKPVNKNDFFNHKHVSVIIHSSTKVEPNLHLHQGCISLANEFSFIILTRNQFPITSGIARTVPLCFAPLPRIALKGRDSLNTPFKNDCSAPFSYTTAKDKAYNVNVSNKHYTVLEAAAFLQEGIFYSTLCSCILLPPGIGLVAAAAAA